MALRRLPEGMQMRLKSKDLLKQLRHQTPRGATDARPHTQETLAKATGCSQQWISHLESGRYDQVEAEFAVALCLALDVKVSTLFDRLDSSMPDSDGKTIGGGSQSDATPAGQSR